MNDYRTKLDEFIDAVPHLPPTPTIMVDLLALFQQPDRGIDQAVALISHDPSLTVEVLKRCNSALFAGAEPASDMFEAVSRLGFYEVYCIVVALFGARSLSVPEVEGGLKMTDLWEHSVTTAVAAGVVARELEESEGVAFTTGLLHDVGKIVLLSADSVQYARLVQQIGPGGAALMQAEQACFGFDHTRVGAHLLARWGLPAKVVMAVRHHHDLAGAEPFQRLAAMVHLANAMAHQLRQNPGTAPDPLSDEVESIALLGLTRERVTTLLRTRELMERTRALISI